MKSRITGELKAGEKIRVDFLKNDWYAIFNLNEKNLLARLRKKSHLTTLELTYLIKLARNTDYDLEERIDWKYLGYQDAKKQILADTQLRKPLIELTGEET